MPHRFIDDKLSEMGIQYLTVEHQPVFTVEQAKSIMPEKFSVKNLLLKEEKGEGLVFVIMCGDIRLDTKKLAATLGLKKLQFASAGVLMNTLGVTPGAASLLCCLLPVASEVRLVIDEDLLKQDELGFHPAQNTMTYIFKKQELEKLIKSLPQKIKITTL